MPKVPVGVKLIAILTWIGAGLSILGALSTLLIAFGTIPVLESVGWADASIMTTGVLVGIAVALFAVAIFQTFIGIGLWKAQNWARVVTIILTGLGVLSALITAAIAPMYAVGWVILDGVILAYLLFNGPVKKAFSAT